jgi:hypothetical protein
MYSILVDLQAAKLNFIVKRFAYWLFQFQASFLQKVQHNPHVVHVLLSRETMD